MFYLLRLITFATAIKWRRPLDTNAMQFWIFRYSTLSLGVMWKRLKVRFLKDNMIRPRKRSKVKKKQRWQTIAGWPSSPWDNLVVDHWRQHPFWWNLDMRSRRDRESSHKSLEIESTLFQKIFGPFRSLTPYTSNDRNRNRNARWQLRSFVTLKIL